MFAFHEKKKSYISIRGQTTHYVRNIKCIHNQRPVNQRNVFINKRYIRSLIFDIYANKRDVGSIKLDICDVPPSYCLIFLASQKLNAWIYRSHSILSLYIRLVRIVGYREVLLDGLSQYTFSVSYLHIEVSTSILLQNGDFIANNYRFHSWLKKKNGDW